MWSPTSWTNFPIKQAIHYPDQEPLKQALETLSMRPPLITPDEVDNLSKQLTQVNLGNSFILQGGDCAESFAECTAENITNKFKILLKMSMILIYGLRKPIIRVGRIAGQYAKPRSNIFETVNQQTLNSYRGDLINQKKFGTKERTPAPKRMLEAYNHSSMTLNYLRALINGGFSSLHTPEMWDLDFIKNTSHSSQYHALINSISDALSFVNTIGGIKNNKIQKIDDFYTSHEALHLPYESALTRKVDDKWYNLSTHFPWLGMRTNELEGAHIEYLRGIENPVAIKIGPQTTPSFISALVKKLNPNNKSGKLMLITRLGSLKVDKLLPDLIKSVQDTNINVIWSSDPMHGNTISTQKGRKTRHFDDISQELNQTFEHHKKLNSFLGGIHLELTGENVTECLGGASDIKENDLDKAFKSLVDPRLNYEQALEIAFQITMHSSNN